MIQVLWLNWLISKAKIQAADPGRPYVHSDVGANFMLATSRWWDVEDITARSFPLKLLLTKAAKSVTDFFRLQHPSPTSIQPIMVTSMLVTKCVGDKFEMLVADSGYWWPI